MSSFWKYSITKLICAGSWVSIYHGLNSPAFPRHSPGVVSRPILASLRPCIRPGYAPGMPGHYFLSIPGQVPGTSRLLPGYGGAGIATDSRINDDNINQRTATEIFHFYLNAHWRCTTEYLQNVFYHFTPKWIKLLTLYLLFIP